MEQWFQARWPLVTASLVFPHFGGSESTICRAVHRVENVLMASGLFRLPGKKQLIRGFGRPEVIVMDVTETPIERPKRRHSLVLFGKEETTYAESTTDHRTKYG